MNRRGTILGTAVVALAAAGAAAAPKDHLVPVSAPWPSAAELSPGDRILLEPGLHDPRTIEDWPGTPEAPIVITSADGPLPAGLAGIGRPALVARRCGSLVVQGLLVVGGGLDFEGDGPDSGDSVTVRDLQVLPESRAPRAPGPKVGIRVASVDRCLISAVGVNRWADAGIWISNTADVTIERPGLVAGIDSLVGIRIESTREARIGGGGIVGSADAAIDVSPGAGEETAVDVRRMVLERPTGGVRIRPGAMLRFDRCTVVEPRRGVFEVVPAPPALPDPTKPTAAPSPAEITVSACLVTWSVGRLERLFRIVEEVPTKIVLEQNLWWSPELPVALEALGGLPNGVDGQILDLDPRLVQRTWLPEAARARPYGHGAPDAPISGSGE